MLSEPIATWRVVRVATRAVLMTPEHARHLARFDAVRARIAASVRVILDELDDGERLARRFAPECGRKGDGDE